MRQAPVHLTVQYHPAQLILKLVTDITILLRNLDTVK